MNSVLDAMREFFKANGEAIHSLDTRIRDLEEKAVPTAATQRVVCAANRYGDLIIPGVRHYDPIMHKLIPKYCAGEFEQGFLDNKGNFLSREEAHSVAKAAGQIIRRVGGDTNKLFSENLY